MVIIIYPETKTIKVKGIKLEETDKIIEHVSEHLDEYKLIEDGKKVNIFELNKDDGFVSSVSY